VVSSDIYEESPFRDLIIIYCRAMTDEDGPQVAKFFYESLFARDQISLDDIPYALDYAVTQLRRSGVPPERWATFIQMGA
jgi:hypothetical protein